MVTTLTGLPFDLDSSPADPPAECVGEFMWALALTQLDEHSRPGTEQCPNCTDSVSCPDRALAPHCLLTACGVESTMTNYWQGLASIRHRQHLWELP